MSAAEPSEECTPQRFRKRPVVIEAMHLTDMSAVTVCRWMGLDQDQTHAAIRFEQLDEDHDAWTGIHIETLEGTMVASPGDWVIRGVQGEFYPCKPDIFAATYEEADRG